MRSLRDALVVAAFDLGESLRSRKVLVLLVLYVAGAVASTVIFTEVLQKVEEELAAQLLVARTDTPGSLTQAVMESPELLRVLTRLVRDAELARELVRVPPVALLYGWVTLTFAPIFVVLTSSETIASELATGSVRFALARTERSSWALGKLLGQAALLAVGVTLGALAAWITGAIRLSSFAPLDSAAWIARYAATSYCFAFAHLGLALGVSQLTRSVPWSRALGLVALASVYAIHGWLSRDEVVAAAPVLTSSVRVFFPVEHRLDLWRTSLVDVLPAAVVLLALGASYFALGYQRLARRDA
jgi:ABC-type transport system involved in multi-copper enzyme maturation permease subunit